MVKINTQTYGLGRELTEDFDGTLEKLRAIGFDGIEAFLLFRPGQGQTPKNLWTFEMLKTGSKKLDELGMQISSAHIGIEFGGRVLPTDVIRDNVRFVRETYGITDFVISGHFGTADAAVRWAEIAGEIAGAIRPCGGRLLYHNHDDEFRKVHRNGKTVDAMEIFLEKTDGAVLLEMDIGWAGMIGDELDILQRYAGQIAVIHLKDFYKPFRNSGYDRTNVPAEAFAPIGEGAIATGSVLARLSQLPRFTGNLVIDQDESAVPMLDALKTGFDRVKAML